MKNLWSAIIASVLFFGAQQGTAAPKSKQKSKARSLSKEMLQKSVKKGKKIRSKKRRRLVKKEKVMIREKRYVAGESSIAFDEATIQGEKIAPAVSTLAIPNVNKEFDLIKIRTRWHDEMILSADYDN